MTDIDTRLREALHPSPDDHARTDPLVDDVLRRGGSTRASDTSAWRRSTRAWAPVGAGLAAAATVVGVLALSPWGRPEAPNSVSSSTSATSPGLVVTCGPGGAVSASVPDVTASSDGVHLTVVNENTGPVTIAEHRRGTEGSAPRSDTEVARVVPPGPSSVVSDAPPGTTAFACGGPQQAAVTIHDPERYFHGALTDLRCAGSVAEVPRAASMTGSGKTASSALHDLWLRLAPAGAPWDWALPGYRDAEPTGAVFFDGGQESFQVRLTKGRVGQSAHIASIVRRCSVPFTPAQAVMPVAAETTRTIDEKSCPDAAQPSWAEPPALGPSPAQAAEALARRMTGRSAAVASMHDDGSAQTWAVLDEGTPLFTVTVRPGTPRQAAFGQSYTAMPSAVCDLSRFSAVTRGR